MEHWQEKLTRTLTPKPTSSQQSTTVPSLPALLLSAVLSGPFLGVVAWQFNQFEKRGLGTLLIFLFCLGQTGLSFGKVIENGEMFSPQIGLNFALWVGTNITLALMTSYAIRSSERIQRCFQPKWRVIRFSLMTLMLLMTLAAVVAACVSSYFR
jgi:hypothetical protein